jgi:hypothetical protein
MNSKYFLLIILFLCKIESHTFLKKTAQQVGLLVVHLQKKSINLISPNNTPELKKTEEIKTGEIKEILVIKEPVCDDNIFSEHSLLSRKPDLEEKLHGLSETDFQYLNSCHPKFLATVLKIQEWSPRAVDLLAWTNKKLIKNWIAQLTEKQAILFCQIRNSTNETFEEFLQKTSTLKALFQEAQKEFQERPQNANTIDKK